MNRLVLLFFAFLTGTKLVTATPVCTYESLAAYVSLGSSGCTIGTSLVSNFTILTPPSYLGNIDPSNVDITPVNGVGAVGIYAWTKGAASNESIFTYEISGNTYSSDAGFVGQYSYGGNAVVYYQQNYCEGGTFGPDGMTDCTGSNPGTLTLFLSGTYLFPSPNYTSTPITPTNMLTVTTQFRLDAGAGPILTGFANGGDFGDIFGVPRGPVPEPLSFLLTAAGLLITGYSVAWRRRRPLSK